MEYVRSIDRHLLCRPKCYDRASTNLPVNLLFYLIDTSAKEVSWFLRVSQQDHSKNNNWRVSRMLLKGVDMSQGIMVRFLAKINRLFLVPNPTPFTNVDFDGDLHSDPKTLVFFSVCLKTLRERALTVCT